MNDIYKKIDIILKSKFPTEEIRNQAIDKIGKIVILELVDEVIERIPNETDKQVYADAINNSDIKQAENICEKYAIDQDEIITRIGKSIIIDLFEKR